MSTHASIALLLVLAAGCATSRGEEAPASSISGRIVGADDSWQVELRDGTEIAPGVMPVVFAEHLSSTRHPFRTSPVTVAPDGTFRIDGLLDRTYVIEAWNPWDPVAIRSDPVAAGTHDLVLHLPVDARQPLSGRVVDLEGQPLVGVTLEVGLDVHVVIQGHHNSILGPGASSGADGRFVFAAVPTRHSRLLLHGDGLVPHAIAIDELLGVADLVLRAERTATVAFEVPADAAPGPDALEVLDDAGLPLAFYTTGERARFLGRRFSLRGFASATVVVPERARTIVALRDGTVLGRYALDVAPGGFGSVRYQPAAGSRRTER